MEYFAVQELVFGNEIVKKGTIISSKEKLDEIYPKMFSKKKLAEKAKETQETDRDDSRNRP